jgi:hypothetical protein
MAVAAQPTAAVEECHPTAVAVVAVAGRMVEVGDTPPRAAVDTAAAVAVVVDTAVAVDTGVAASETLNCVVDYYSSSWIDSVVQSAIQNRLKIGGRP